MRSTLFLICFALSQSITGQMVQSVFIGFNNNISQLQEIDGALNNEANFGASIGYSILAGSRKIRFNNTAQFSYFHNTLSTNFREGELRKYYLNYNPMVGFFPNDKFGLLIGPTVSFLLGTNDIDFQEGSHLPLDIGATGAAHFYIDNYRFTLSYMHGFLAVDEYRLKDDLMNPIGIVQFYNKVLEVTIGYTF